MRDPAVQRSWRIKIVSSIAMGTPARSEGHMPLSSWVSTAAAAAKADSGEGLMKQLQGSEAICSRVCLATSRAVSSRRRIFSANSRAVRVLRIFIDIIGLSLSF